MSFNQDISEKINLAIEDMLASDPANQSYLQNLEGLTLRVNCTLPPIVFLIEYQDGALNLHRVASAYPSEEPNQKTVQESDLQISGTAFNLLRLATLPLDNASALRSANLSVDGDIGLLLELSRVAKMIDIDWEALLAEKMGETPAVILSRTFGSGLRAARKVRDNLSFKLAEKMKTDNSPLPNKAELNGLKKQLRELNYRLDRLEATASEKQSL